MADQPSALERILNERDRELCDARAELAELAALRYEAYSQRSRGDVLAEINDNLRAALAALGCPVTHEVVKEAEKLAAALRAKAELAEEASVFLREQMTRLEAHGAGDMRYDAWLCRYEEATRADR